MFFKMLMIWMILISILISISSNFWFIYWMMLEINLMAFLPIMNNKNISNCNSLITYFVIQSFSSSLFFVGSMMWFTKSMSLFLFIIMISMLIKLAMIPFHFWILLMSESLDLNALLILLTIQKVIPLFILTKIKSEIIIFFSLASSIFGSLMALSSKMIRKIMIFSSISHMGWMTIIINILSNFWIIYLTIYSLILFKFFNLLKKNKVYSISNFFMKKFNTNEKIMLTSSMMSLSGMPPFMGFFMKLISILMIMKISLLITMILVISSLINIYFYMRILSPIFFLLKNFNKNFNIKKMMKTSFTNLNMTMLIMIMSSMMN
uniref:NADH-ubiquinone oxidoreductase chain 2 n=1 Tax=Bothriocroton concolor TaxID=65640 RepID=H9M722_BOTCN|nr:NADH dehydrogenase subunit 2 [Bothriocroton concolor]AET63039.1 NADH dehydrogenase subunit 2 [Bothriocroton concolor]